MFNCKTKRSTRVSNNMKKKANFKKLKRDVKGITLIALIVTIIVLLILAGVAISLTIGQNGIFSRAQLAANVWRNAEANEQLAMGELEDWIDNNSEDSNLINAAKIAENPKLYYGKKVTNYTKKDGENVECQIFYADSNIYLIMSNLGEYGGKSEVKVTENNPAYKWIDSYLDIYPDSNNSGMQATNYFLDVNSWSDYTSSYVEYSIGAPTLELFVASYNQINDNKIEYKVEENDDKGYYIKLESDSDYAQDGITLIDEANGIYTGSPQAMYIASPTANGEQFTSMVLTYRYLDIVNASSPGKCRAVVCLKEDVKLVDNGDDTFSIKL